MGTCLFPSYLENATILFVDLGYNCLTFCLLFKPCSIVLHAIVGEAVCFSPLTSVAFDVVDHIDWVDLIFYILKGSLSVVLL